MDVRKQMFISSGIHRVARNDAWEYIIGLKALLKVNKTSSLDTGGWHMGFQGVHLSTRMSAGKPVGQLPSEAALLDKFLTWIGDLNPGAIVMADDVRESLQRNSGIRVMIQNETGRAAYERSRAYTGIASEAPSVLGEIYDLAQKDPRIAAAWDALMARDVASVSATPEQIIQESPELVGLLSKLTEIPTDEAGRDHLKKQIDSLTSELTQNSKKLELIDAKTQRMKKSLDSLVSEAAEGQRKLKEATQQKAREDALRGAVALYGFFGGDKQTTRRLNAVLDAYVGARVAVAAYNAALAAEVGTATAMLGLTGGWVGVALTLASAFSEDEGQGAQQQLMEALNQLSQQLADIQKQIAQGFEYVDARLTALSRDIAIGFETVLAGIQANQFQLRKLLAATYALAANFDTYSALIVKKLDYAIDTPAYEQIFKFANWKRMNGTFLGPEQLGEAAAAVAAFSNRSLDEMHTGVELKNLNGDFDAWLQSRPAEAFQAWAGHINTLLSICRLLGVDLPDKSAPNPEMWKVAAAALMEIGANNTDPPSQLGLVLLPKLIEDGACLVENLAALRQAGLGTSSGAELVFAFLLQKYEAAVNDVIDAVVAIHAEKLSLANNGTTGLDYLPEYFALEKFMEDVARTAFDSPVFKLNGEEPPWMRATPSTKDMAIMPLPKNQLGQMAEGGEERWKGGAMGDLVPSIYEPNAWPTVSSAQAWAAFPLEVRSCALVGSMLGLGSVSVEYQAQIERWFYQEVAGINLIGLPIVHYVLLLSSKARRAPLACASRYMADCHLGLVRCYSTEPRNKSEPIGLKKNFDQSRVALMPVFPGLVPNCLEFSELTVDTQARYCSIASQIRSEIDKQLSSTVSELGSRAATLDRTTSLIRLVAQWLLPDRLTFDGRLRTSLYGSTRLLMPQSAGFELPVALTRSPDLIIPLLDVQTLKNMCQLREDQDQEHANAWTNFQLLGALSDWRDASGQALADAVRLRQGLELGPTAAPDVADILEELRLHQRYFPPKASQPAPRPTAPGFA